jgi:hypothetical protein
MNYTNGQLAEEARREASRRRSVYPRISGGGELSARRARQIEMMEQIAAEYEARAVADGTSTVRRPVADMFGE